MLNRNSDREARLRYLPGAYRVVSDGDHVVCAVTGARIPLGELRYWSHELQEAFASAEVASARHAQARAEGLL
jgi:hypothetical protein